MQNYEKSLKIKNQNGEKLFFFVENDTFSKKIARALAYIDFFLYLCTRIL